MADTKINEEKDEDILAERGKVIAAILCLRPKGNGRYNTAFGDKTPLGLARTLQRFLSEDATASEKAALGIKS